MAVISESFESFSISFSTFSKVIPPFFEPGNLYSLKLLFSPFMLKKELHAFKLVNLTIYLELRPRLIDESNEKVFFWLVKLKY